MWRGKLRWIFRGCGRAVKFPPMLWNMGRELYNRREMIYILTVRQAVQVVGGGQNLLENFLSTSPQRAIDKLYRLYKRSKSKRLVKRKDVLLSRPSFQLLTHSSPQTSPILKVR